MARLLLSSRVRILCQAEFEHTVRRIDPTVHPTITGQLDRLADAAFALRWHGGQDRPLDESFEAALAIWPAGLERALAG